MLFFSTFAFPLVDVSAPEALVEPVTVGLITFFPTSGPAVGSTVLISRNFNLIFRALSESSCGSFFGSGSRVFCASLLGSAFGSGSGVFDIELALGSGFTVFCTSIFGNAFGRGFRELVGSNLVVFAQCCYHCRSREVWRVSNFAQFVTLQHHFQSSVRQY
jgi:hypothetical protein